ncbi:hypothetical protein O3G_MSEX006266 [Manduca sexta]|uniref:Uncharacterized protein n=1 Tax=Manduca sexta TaxID=7130 RepID=A0A921Z2U6_MANSE|nr:hypothetical protein O3G_MSEX006266 [Manduca sexta]
MKGLHLTFILLICYISLYNAVLAFYPAPQPFLDTIKECTNATNCVINDSGKVSSNNNKQS